VEGVWQAITDLWDALVARTAPLRAVLADEASQLGDRLATLDIGLSRDAAVVATLLLFCLSLPALAAAFAERRAPRVGAMLLILAMALGWWTVETYQGPWTVDTVMRSAIQVIADLTR